MTELPLIKSLITQIRQTKHDYNYVLAPARGGLIPAQFLAYALDIKDIYVLNHPKGGYTRSQPTQNVLIVDDINDTGATIMEIVAHMREHDLANHIDVATIYQRYSTKRESDFVGEVVRHDEYIQFTWDKEIK